MGIRADPDPGGELLLWHHPVRRRVHPGAAQTIITTAVTTSNNPAAPVSNVDLERAPLTTAFIVRILFPVETPYALNVGIWRRDSDGAGPRI